MQTDETLCPSCMEPLSYPSGDGCARMIQHARSEPFVVVVTDVVEEEDGSASYTFEIGDKALVGLAHIGLEFTLYCAVHELDLQFVLDNLGQLTKKEEDL